MTPTLHSCVEGTVGTCDDFHDIQVGPPLWVIVIGVVVVLAAVVAIFSTLLVRANRCRP